MLYHTSMTVTEDSVRKIQMISAAELSPGVFQATQFALQLHNRPHTSYFSYTTVTEIEQFLN